MKILISGGGGFLARGMTGPLTKGGHQLRLMGVHPIQSEHEVIQGDVTRMEDVYRAMSGIDAVVINHMASRQSDAYERPGPCFDVNVKGTANILHAAAETGVRKIVLISSIGCSPKPPEDPVAWRRQIPLPSDELYSLTKSCQEVVAQHYARCMGLQVTALRIGYVVDAEQMEDKYGRPVGERAPADTDRRDVGEVARLCLERTADAFEVFVVMSTHEAHELWGLSHTIDTLGWTPRYDFDRLPLPSTTSKNYNR